MNYYAFNIGKNPKYDGYQQGIASLCTNFLTKSMLVLLLKQEPELILKTNSKQNY